MTDEEKVIVGLKEKLGRRDARIEGMGAKIRLLSDLKLKVDRRLAYSRFENQGLAEEVRELKARIADLDARLLEELGRYVKAQLHIRELQDNDTWVVAIRAEWQRRCDEWRELHPDPKKMPDDERKWLLESLAALDFENTRLSVEVAQLRED